jgi:hypothetical protein
MKSLDRRGNEDLMQLGISNRPIFFDGNLKLNSLEN